MMPARIKYPTVFDPTNMLTRTPGVQSVATGKHDPAVLWVANYAALAMEPADHLARSVEERFRGHARSTISADRAPAFTDSAALRALDFLTYVSLVARTCPFAATIRQ